MTTHPPSDARGQEWLAHPLALAVAVVAVYAASLTGPWLHYDDNWLVEQNELLTRSDPAILGRVFFAFDAETRIVLGAEYLPVRDVLTWLLRGVIGLDVGPLRTIQLGIYVLSMLLLQRWAVPLGRPLVLAVWLFALHPIHAESVAWLAGLKDLLALAFVSAALLAYSRGGRLRWAVPMLVGLACLSKAAAVIAPGLLLAHDILVARRPDRPILGASFGVAIGLAALHAWVGSIVHMYAPPLADGIVERALTLATLLVRYLGLAFLVHPNSVFYEVAPSEVSVPSLGAVLLVLALGGVAAWAWRRGSRWPAVALGVFLVGLAPVLQIVAPLQNRMADRYLLFAVLGPMMVLGFGLDAAMRAVRPSLGRPMLVGVMGTVGLLALIRGLLFADPIALFDEATARTEHDAGAPFMLAEALLREGRLAEAEAAYRTAIERDGLTGRRGLSAANNLGRLLTTEGRLPEARALFLELTEHYPDDARSLHNLAEVERLMGEADAASRHRAELAERFPTYRPGADRPGPL